MQPFLLAASCVCHPHKHSDAAIMLAVSVAAAKCCICAHLYLSGMEQPRGRSSWDALDHVCALLFHKWLWPPCLQLEQAPELMQLRLKKVCPGFWSPPWWKTKLWDTRRGDHLRAHHTLYLLPTPLQLEWDQMLHLFQCWKWFMLPLATVSCKLNLASSWNAQSQFACRGMCFDEECCCLWNTILRRRKEDNSPPK